MVVINLKGGLGNQMFQYAAARGFASGKTVSYSLSFLDANATNSEYFTQRKFELNIFKKLRATELSRFHHSILFNSRFRKLGRILYPNLQFVTQVENEFVNINSSKSPICLDGYFQSENYFSFLRDELINEFTFPEVDKSYDEILKQIENTNNSVSIHVRRGDYLKPEVMKYHGILPLKYYENAIKIIEAKLNDPYYFIFSDDPKWCQENFKIIENRSTVVSGNKLVSAWNDMVLMTKCRHHIVANSSFSWWGAWLSNTFGIKTAPMKWFNPEYAKFCVNDFVPSNWLLIQYD